MVRVWVWFFVINDAQFTFLVSFSTIISNNYIFEPDRLPAKAEIFSPPFSAKALRHSDFSYCYCTTSILYYLERHISCIKHIREINYVQCHPHFYFFIRDDTA
jgi:hypothetical protein